MGWVNPSGAPRLFLKALVRIFMPFAKHFYN